MQVRTYDDWQAFATAAAPVLESDEVGHCLVYTIQETLRDSPDPQHRPWLAVIADAEGTACAIAAMLPPNPLILSPLTPPAPIALLAAALVDGGRVDDVGRVVGRPDVVTGFAQAWRERTGRDGHVHTRMRLHRIDAAPSVPATSGYFSPMTADDVDMVVQWVAEFTREAWGEDVEPAQVAPRIRARLASSAGALVVWRDGDLSLSMACHRGV